MNELRNLTDLTLDELKHLRHDLDDGVRYNILKIKYALTPAALDRNSSAECRKLIAEREPKPITPQNAAAPVNLNTWYDSNGELHYSMRPNANCPWTNPDLYKNYVQPTTPEGWYMPDPSTKDYRSFMTAKENGRLDEWYRAFFGDDYENARIVRPGEIIV